MAQICLCSGKIIQEAKDPMFDYEEGRNTLSMKPHRIPHFGYAQ